MRLGSRCYGCAFISHNSVSCRKYARVWKQDYKTPEVIKMQLAKGLLLTVIHMHLAKIDLSRVAQVRWVIMCTQLHSMDCVRVRVRVSVIMV